MQYTKDLNTPANWADLKDKEKLCERIGIDYGKIFSIVEDIENNIIEKGDRYISELSKKFDNVDIKKFLVTKKEILDAEKSITQEFRNAIDQAYKNIFSFHLRQKRENLTPQETSKGVECWQEFRPIETVGLYIPGGTAPLFSTVLMLAIPAQIAGCKKIIICTPPNPAPEILYVAQKCGVQEIYQIGGSQAIFAMSHGTEQVPKVQKIFGPGNSFVTAAKMKISGRTAIDMPAGPSEVLVIADDNANAEFVAADLLSQAEHGEDSQSVLVCVSIKKAEEILQETLLQLQNLPRKNTAQKSLEHSFAVICTDTSEMIEFSNLYAPEHLILHLDDWKKYTDQIINAGSVFCGQYSCESAGDYSSGTNHTLPTSGFAASFSGVNIDSYGKWVTFQHLSKSGIQNLGKTVEIMAAAEGLDAHKNAVSVRIKQ